MQKEHKILESKVALVTGGTGGIGKATALGIAQSGATVIVVGRDALRGKAAVEELQAKSGSRQIDLLLADFSSQDSIRQLAQEVSDRYPRLDILVNNVGGMYAQRHVTVDGLEQTFAVTHLAAFLLTNLLLPLLQASAPSRIINVNSSGHRSGQIDFADLQSEHEYRPSRSYGQAKLANVLFTYELARRLTGTGVTVNIADPGGADTQITRSAAAPWIFRTVIIPILGKSLLTTARAAQSSIYLATAPELEQVTGKYFNFNKKEVRSSPASYDEQVARQLWRVSEQLTGLSLELPA